MSNNDIMFLKKYIRGIIKLAKEEPLFELQENIAGVEFQIDQCFDGKNLIIQALENKISEMAMSYNNATAEVFILKQDKEELITMINKISINCNYHLDCPMDEALKKYSGE